jgi:putative copper resistance protein D
VATFSVVIKFAHLAAAAFLLGSLAFQQFVALPALRAAGADNEIEADELKQRHLVYTRWALAALFVTGLLGFWLQIATVSNLSLAQALAPANAVGVLLGTRYGAVWLARAGLMVLLAFLISGGRARSWNKNRLPALIIAAALVVALAFSSHAAAGEGVWLAAQLSVYALHLLPAAIWIGGLPALALFLGWLRRADRPWLQAALMEATRRFSLLGLVCVTVLIIGGLYNSWILVGSIPALVGTAYGQLLLVKLGLLLPLLVIAAINLRKLKPRILALDARSGAASKELLARLKRQVVAEAGLAACILLVVGFMGVTPPARHVQPEWPFASRWNLNLLNTGSAKVRAQLTEAKWWGAAGLVALFGGMFLRRRYRYLTLGAGIASLGYGVWIANSALSIDAYPATYLRPSVPYNAISVANGLRLYHEACVGCHGVGGYGDGPNGKGLKPRPADLTAKHSADHTAGDLFWWLSHGMKVDGAPGPMPGFAASLDEEERWDMINFLRALSAAERAREMSALVEPEPWLVAPDFVYRAREEESRSLKDHRGNQIVMLVLFSLPESRGRLHELETLSQQLANKKVSLLAIPSEIEQVAGLNSEFKSISFVTDGSREAFDTYALLRRSFSEQGTLPDPPVPSHLEFLVDRQGYIRARWIPRDGPGWDKVENLVREIDRLKQEKPSAPAPDDHVH